MAGRMRATSIGKVLRQGTDPSLIRALWADSETRTSDFSVLLKTYAVNDWEQLLWSSTETALRKFSWLVKGNVGAAAVLARRVEWLALRSAALPVVTSNRRRAGERWTVLVQQAVVKILASAIFTNLECVGASVGDEDLPRLSTLLLYTGIVIPQQTESDTLLASWERALLHLQWKANRGQGSLGVCEANEFVCLSPESVLHDIRRLLSVENGALCDVLLPVSLSEDRTAEVHEGGKFVGAQEKAGGVSVRDVPVADPHGKDETASGADGSDREEDSGLEDGSQYDDDDDYVPSDESDEDARNLGSSAEEPEDSED